MQAALAAALLAGTTLFPGPPAGPPIRDSVDMELEQFPFTARAVKAMRNLALAHRDWVHTEYENPPIAWERDSNWAYQCWDTLDDAHTKWFPVQVRAEKLRQLREFLGDEAYFAGRMPTPAAGWRFLDGLPLQGLTPPTERN